jgi:hypothetical protein
MSERRLLLAVLQMAKVQLALSDAAWRDLIERETGQASCDAAGDAALLKLMRRLKLMGFGSHRAAEAAMGRCTTARKPQARLVWALWAELGRLGALRDNSRAACRAFCAATAKIPAITDPDFMTTSQLDPVIIVLKAWLARTKERRGAAGPMRS